MSEILNNKKLDFYRNQINPNQNNQEKIFMRNDRREVSFIVDKNFLESTFNKFLYDNLQKIQQIAQNNRSIAQLYNIFQIMAQEITKIKNDISEAFYAEEKKIGEIKEINNQQINNMYDIWNKENSKNINDIKLV